MGEEEAELTRKQLGWSYKPFEVPQDAYDQYRQAIQKGAQLEEEWNQSLATYKEKYPNEASQFERMLRGELPEGWDKELGYHLHKKTHPRQSQELMVLVL